MCPYATFPRVVVRYITQVTLFRYIYQNGANQKVNVNKVFAIHIAHTELARLYLTVLCAVVTFVLTV